LRLSLQTLFFRSAWLIPASEGIGDVFRYGEMRENGMILENDTMPRFWIFS
jgi:hypothetical protein